MKVCLLDPGIENHQGTPSSNLGDLIIQEAVNRELNEIFGRHIVRLSTQTPLRQNEFKLLEECSIIFVGGTNLLSSYMNKYKQWKISFVDALRIKKAILFGVGWWQYQKTPNFYTSWLIKTAISNKFIHSVRDNYTKAKLQKIGIRNIINTSCPTTWPLAKVKPEEIPSSKSQNVLVMLTDYNKNVYLDKKLLEMTFNKYEKVFFWPQGRGDKDYILDLGFPVTVLEHSLEALDCFISSGISFDYIGTRLHGGIRCLCSRKRSLILAIDNRAEEIANDIQIPIVTRTDLNKVESWINDNSITKINLDLDAISTWKSQFIGLNK